MEIKSILPVNPTSKEKHCKTCVYANVSANLGGLYCDYTSIVGESRNCDPRHCDKYEKAKGKRGKKQWKI